MTAESASVALTIALVGALVVGALLIGSIRGLLQEIRIKRHHRRYMAQRRERLARHLHRHTK